VLRAQEPVAEDPDPTRVEAIERTDCGDRVGLLSEHVDSVNNIFDSVK
jgi:hypothetical protein